MTEYAILLSGSVRDWFQGFYFDYRVLLPGILIAVVLVLVLARLLKPPKV